MPFPASRNMYLVIDPITGFHIFLEQDPRGDGYDGPVEQDVKLEEADAMVSASQDATAAIPCLGRSPQDDRHYRVFESMKQCRQAGFEPCGTVYAKYQTWREFSED